MTQYLIEEKTLLELKCLALKELGLTRDEVKGYGDLRCRQTWIDAIEEALSSGQMTQQTEQFIEENSSLYCWHRRDEIRPVAISQGKKSDAPPPLQKVEYLYNHNALERIECLFSDKSTQDLLVDPADLKLLQIEDNQFFFYDDWLYPGNFFCTLNGSVHQVLCFDKLGCLYHIPITSDRVWHGRIYDVARSTFPSIVTDPKAVNYVLQLNKMMLMPPVNDGIRSPLQHLNS